MVSGEDGRVPVELPLKNLDEKSLRAALREIGSEDGASQGARGQPADG